MTPAAAAIALTAGAALANGSLTACLLIAAGIELGAATAYLLTHHGRSG